MRDGSGGWERGLSELGFSFARDLLPPRNLYRTPYSVTRSPFGLLEVVRSAHPSNRNLIGGLTAIPSLRVAASRRVLRVVFDSCSGRPSVRRSKCAIRSENANDVANTVLPSSISKHSRTVRFERLTLVVSLTICALTKCWCYGAR